MKLHHNAVDHTGRKYNMLTGVRPDAARGGTSTWVWRCDCEAIKTIPTGAVVGGKTKSCGCAKNELLRIGRTKHGHSTCKHTRNADGGSSEYRSWNSMKSRCLKENDKDYPNYGGRGITICERWVNSFQDFLSDMGLKPTTKHTIHRINNEGNYEPSNCKWADAFEQGAGKRTSRYFTAGGVTMTVAQWARRIGCSRQALRYRINHGGDPLKIISLKFHKGNKLSKC